MADFSNLDKPGDIMSTETGSCSLNSATGCGTGTARSARYRRNIPRCPGAPPRPGRRHEFADMRAAYDALDERTKAEVEALVCEHSLVFSREAIGFTDLTPRSPHSARYATACAHPSGRTGRKVVVPGLRMPARS